LIYYFIINYLNLFFCRWFKSPDLNPVSGRLLTTVTNYIFVYFGPLKTTR